MASQIVPREESRQASLASVNLLKDAVQATLGSRVVNVTTEEQFGSPSLTNHLGITVEKSRTMESDLEIAEGTKFDCGYLSPHFVTDPLRMEVTFEDAYILIYERTIRSIEDLAPLLEQIGTSGKPLLIVAEDIEDGVLATLVVKKLRGTMNVAAVKASGFVDDRKAMLQHIAILTGGKAITEDLGIKLQNVQISDLGRAKKIRVGKDKTIIIEGKGKSRCN